MSKRNPGVLAVKRAQALLVLQGCPLARLCVTMSLPHNYCALPFSSADTWETIKLNQCYSVYIEGCDVAGAGDNAIDMVAVQYGHVMGSAIHDANWCMYLKVRGVEGDGQRGVLVRAWGLRRVQVGTGDMARPQLRVPGFSGAFYPCKAWSRKAATCRTHCETERTCMPDAVVT